MLRTLTLFLCCLLMVGCYEQPPRNSKPSPEKLQKINDLRQQLKEATESLRSLNIRNTSTQRELDKTRENMKKWQLAQNTVEENPSETPTLENSDPSEISPDDKDRKVDYSGLIAAGQAEINSYLKKLNELSTDIEQAQEKVHTLETRLAELEK